MSNKDDNLTAVLLEDIQDQLQRVFEIVSALVQLPAKVDGIDTRLRTVETDVKVIKAVVTDQSKELANHEHRITTLETA